MDDQRDREVVISIKSNCGQGSPQSSKRRRNTELTNQEISGGCGGGGTSMAEVARSSSNASFRKSSWKGPLSKTKSRLIDPVAEPRQKSERRVDSDSGGPHSDNESSYEDDLDDIPEEYKGTKCSLVSFLQWVSLALIMAALGCSLWIPILKRQNLWGLPLWKWEILVLALICGRLVSAWVIRLVVIVIERNFLLRRRVLYFVYGLRRSVQNCLWLGLVLLVWHGIFDKKVQEKTKSRILPYVTKILVCFLVGTLFWLLKTLLVKVLALSFHVNNSFERIQEALFHQYVIETLSGPPISLERHETREFQSAGAAMPSELRTTLLPRNDYLLPPFNRSPTFSRHASERHDKKIPIEYLHKLNPKNISAWNMRRMMRIIRNGSLATLDERVVNSDTDDESSLQIKTVCQAKEAAKRRFSPESPSRGPSICIFLEDLMRFMSKDEAMRTIHLFGEAAEKKGICKAALNDWVVNAFRERRALALSLNDTKTAVDELHSMLNILVAILIVITSLFLLGIPIAHFLVFISSQLLLVVFVFGNTCRTIFEAIIFLFVVHPFDVGDRCEVDGVQMVVEEMNILTTIFLRYDNQKVIYPNSVLATRPIANFYRSPDMGDAVDFCVHISTPMEKIATIKERIKRYIQSRGDHWHPDPMLIMKDVDDLNKLKFSVWLTHRMNHQDIGERWTRRALLVEEMIRVFRELDIDYRMLPLDVNIRSLPNCNSDDSPSTSMWAAYFAAEELMKNAYASGAY